MKRLLMSLSLITLSSVSVLAQGTEKAFLDDPFNHPLLPVYIVSFFILVVVVLIAFTAYYLVRILNMLTEEAERERAKKEGKAYAPKPTVWKRFVQEVNASVPLEREADIELEHNYDGIKELDNHLPPWWKWLFYGTIGWSAVYLVVYHITSTLPLSGEEYQAQVTLAEERSRALQAMRPVAEVDENALQFSADSTTIITRGKTVFTDNNCGSCHRADGGGNSIGPNLTDEYWIHGGHIKNVFGTIKNGAVDKGMPAWGKSLSPQQVKDVAFFVLSLQGTKPENAKAPQGEIYREAKTAVKPDSTQAQASL